MDALEMRTNELGETKMDLAKDQAAYIANIPSWQKNNLKPATSYACVMIEIPDGYRLATEEEMQKPKPEHAKFFSDTERRWMRIQTYAWDRDLLYALPIKPAKRTITIDGKDIEISEEGYKALKASLTK